MSTKVNWHEQWKLFAHNFHSGKAHIPLTPYSCPHTLRLLPGPGFGDLSHPTTQLMLELLAPHAHNPILDIGTGSGILALAALLLGAPSAIGIDIDPSAIAHAQANAQLNNLPATFTTTPPKNLPPSLLLLNMILPEQIQVHPPTYNPYARLWITSGILATQKTAYLAQTAKWGWTLLEQRQKDQWLAFIFKVKNPM